MRLQSHTCGPVLALLTLQAVATFLLRMQAPEDDTGASGPRQDLAAGAR